MKKVTVLLVTLSLASPVALGSGSLADAKGSKDPVSLGRRNRISASGSAGARVTLSRGARLSLRAFGNRDVTLKGGAGIMMLALVAEPITPDSLQWIATRWPWCSADGCAPRDRITVEALNWTADRIDGGELVLPAGNYRIYLLSPQRAAVATLRLNGPRGKRAVSLADRTFGRTRLKHQRVLEAEQAEITTEIDHQKLRSAGVYVFGASIRSAEGNYGGYLLSECLAEARLAVPPATESPASCTNHEGLDVGGPSIRDELWSYRSLGPENYAASVTFARVGTLKPPEHLRMGWAWLGYE